MIGIKAMRIGNYFKASDYQRNKREPVRGNNRKNAFYLKMGKIWACLFVKNKGL